MLRRAATRTHRSILEGFEAIAKAGQPVLAMIRGFCAGGGMALAKRTPVFDGR